MRFHADLPAGRAMDRDAQRLSSSLNCQPLDTFDGGEMAMLVWTEIPGADLSFGYGLALVDKAELRGVFADGHTMTFPVINASFVVVFQTAQDMTKLQLRAGGKVIKTCHPRDVTRHC